MKVAFSVFIILFFVVTTVAQAKYITKNGSVVMEASVPSFEAVKASNSTTSAILNTENGQFAALCLIKAFRFKLALMEEHFNENYLESDNFPKAIFKGQIENFSIDNLKATSQEFQLLGELTIHGVTNKIKTPITLMQKAGQIVFKCTYSLKPQDYNISIPSIVRNKIAETVLLSLHFELERR
jgi:hypothetical protein